MIVHIIHMSLLSKSGVVRVLNKHQVQDGLIKKSLHDYLAFGLEVLAV